MKLEFDNTGYRFSPGNKPRGSWGFRYSPDTPIEKVIFSPDDMSLTEAKDWFRETHPEISGIVYIEA